MSPLAAYGLLAHALIFGALLACLPLGILRQKVALAGTAASLLIGIAPGLHGIFGPPSVTVLQLAVLQLASKSPSPFTFRPAVLVLVLAALYLSTAWGLGPVDPYGLGYQPLTLLSALAPVALALAWRGMHQALLLLSLDVAAFATGIFPNFWDVLIDPLLILLALGIVLRQGWQSLAFRHQHRLSPRR